MPSEEQPSALAETIKLGVDVHLESYVVVAKVDASAPGRPRRLKPDEFIAYVQELQGQCRQLYSCYEAGCFGYSLHRRLLWMGVANYVIQPVNWNERGKRVKTDARDARAMALCLDGYLRGNDRSFSVVTVPSERQERVRSLVRQRDGLVKERRRNVAKARGSARYYGRSLKGEWWRPSKWKLLKGELEGFLVELLEVHLAVILEIDRQLAAASRKVEQLDQPALPSGMGPVIYHTLEREACDWSRFASDRKVSSYTGLCPTEDSSADRRFQGSIDKSGNPRMRKALVELVWLLMKWNRGYRGFEKWNRELLSPKLSAARKKKIVVAVARQFAVDWWKVRTGRATPEELGLEMKPARAQAA